MARGRATLTSAAAPRRPRGADRGAAPPARAPAADGYGSRLPSPSPAGPRSRTATLVRIGVQARGASSRRSCGTRTDAARVQACGPAPRRDRALTRRASNTVMSSASPLPASNERTSRTSAAAISAHGRGCRRRSVSSSAGSPHSSPDASAPRSRRRCRREQIAARERRLAALDSASARKIAQHQGRPRSATRSIFRRRATAPADCARRWRRPSFPLAASTHPRNAVTNRPVSTLRCRNSLQRPAS